MRIQKNNAGPISNGHELTWNPALGPVSALALSQELKPAPDLWEQEAWQLECFQGRRGWGRRRFPAIRSEPGPCPGSVPE